MKTIEILNNYKSDTPSAWREEAEVRRANSRWLRYSMTISLLVKQRMSEIGMTQLRLAQKMGCTQQHVSMLLKGNANLTLETISKLEEALDLNIIGESLILIDGYDRRSNVVRRTYLSDVEQEPYGKNKNG